MAYDRTPGNERMFFADAIRAFAILLVILFHSTNFYVDIFKPDPNGWLITNVIRSFAYPCVPLFFMLSGMLLLDPGKNESIGFFFRKRFMKVFIPFPFWAAVGFWYLAIIENKVYTGFNILQIALNGPVFDHLWFVYILLGLYFATPVLRVYTHNAERSNMTYFLAVWFIAVGLLPILKEYHLKVGIKLLIESSFIGYFLAGYYLKKIQLSSKQIWIVLIIFALALASTVYMTYYLTVKAGGKVDHFFWHNTRPNVIIMAFCLFLILRSLPYEKFWKIIPAMSTLVRYLAETSYGVYLVHYFLIVALIRGDFGFQIHKLGGSPVHPATGIALIFISTTVLSYTIVSIFRIIPGLKRIV